MHADSSCDPTADDEKNRFLFYITRESRWGRFYSSEWPPGDRRFEEGELTAVDDEQQDAELVVS